MTLVKHLGGAAAVGMALLVGAGLSAPPAQAAYTVTLMQQGSNVVATGSGAIDLTGLSFDLGSAVTALIDPGIANISTGSTSEDPIDLYTGFTGPTNFGSGNLRFPNSGGGDKVMIVNSSIIYGEPVLGVPSGYMSGTSLSDTSTYDNKTFSSLGVTPGTYVWTWGSVGDDSFTLDIEAAAAPEPASVALLALPLGLVMLYAARHRRVPRYLNVVTKGRSGSPPPQVR